MIKRLVKRSLLMFGYELRKPKKQYGWEKDNLRKPGISPRTVVDVGVAYGTPKLYEAFPGSTFVLIEPLKEFEADLDGILKKYKGRKFLTAVGDQEGSLLINIEPQLTKSSIRERTDLTITGNETEKRTIPITTLDKLQQQYEFEPPFGLKVDTEGFELSVINGASEFLKNTQFVIAEVSLARRFHDSYTFAEFILAMDKHGFGLCDILNSLRSRDNTEVLFMDAMFVRKNNA